MRRSFSILPPVVVRSAVLCLVLTMPPLQGFGTFPDWSELRNPPKITEQPKSLTVEKGQPASFKVVLDSEKKDGEPHSSTEDLAYQWMRNGTRVTGATTSVLTLNSAQPADAGTYTVVISNRYGRSESAPAVLTVIIPVPATIITQPLPLTVTEGATATFSVTAAGTPAPTYRWRRNGQFIAGATSASFNLSSARLDDAGDFDVLVANSTQSVLSRAVSLRVLPAGETGRLSPSSASEPGRVDGSSSLVRRPGDSVTLRAPDTDPLAAYQWKRNGVAIPGATAPELTLTSLVAADMGFYSVVTRRESASTNVFVTTLNVVLPGSSRLANLSTRAVLAPGHTLTPGFSLRGTGDARLLVRAVGPSLTQFGVSGTCSDPVLALIPAGEAIASHRNDDWAGDPQSSEIRSTAAAVGAFPLDAAAKDAAIVGSFPAGWSFTAQVSGANSSAGGLVLAEIYDAGSASSSAQLAAVSTLGHVGTGERALVAGFSISGSAPKRVLVRAAGPSLSTFGIGDAVSDPHVTLAPSAHDFVIAANDNWDSDAEIITAAAAVGAFPLQAGSRDAALVVTLPPGGYTVTVSGRDGAGSALLEIYDLDR